MTTPLDLMYIGAVIESIILFVLLSLDNVFYGILDDDSMKLPCLKVRMLSIHCRD